MNPLLTPELGTYVWSLVIFLTVLFVLKKFAWNPLLDFLEEREKDIADSLKMAESAKTDLEKIKEESEKILNEAKKEGKTIVSDSKQKAEESANKILNDAKEKSNEFLDDAKSKIDIEKSIAIVSFPIVQVFCAVLHTMSKGQHLPSCCISVDIFKCPDYSL